MLNKILIMFLNKITNLSYFYTIIFVISWCLCFNKLSSIQLETLFYIKQSYLLDFNSKFITINKCLNNAALVNKGIHNPPQEFIINISKNCIVNNKINIDLLHKIVLKKLELNSNLYLWEKDWDLWLKYKDGIFFHPKNSLTLNIEKLDESIKNNKNELNKIENNITILKKTKIKLLFGFGILLLSDFALNKIFNN